MCGTWLGKKGANINKESDPESEDGCEMEIKKGQFNDSFLYSLLSFFLGHSAFFFYQKKFLSHCFSKSQIFVLLGSTGSYSKDQDSLVKKKSMKFGEISGIQFTKRPKTSKLKMNNFLRIKSNFLISSSVSIETFSLFITKKYQTD